MISIQGLRKPQYLFRPSQIFRRLLQEIRPRHSRDSATLPWDLKIQVDASDTVGDALVRQGVYDIVTTEVLWRLTNPGDRTIDVGANVGYLTSLLSIRAGPSGSVLAFEPHPQTFLTLQENVVAWNRDPRCAQITPVRAALSSTDGSAFLDLIAGQERNTSYAFLNPQPSPKGIPVETLRLERFLNTHGQIGIMKIDAQWHEADVLAGAGNHLASGDIRDILYEEDAGFPAPSHTILQNAGYTIFWFEEHLSGPRLIPPTQHPSKRRSYEILPSYLATREPNRAVKLMSSNGWHSLRGV